VVLEHKNGVEVFTMSAYEEVKAWLERTFGSRFVSQSVSIEDGVVAIVEEDVDIPPEAAVLLDDVYDALGLRDAPWLVEEDLGARKIVKFPVGP